MKKIPLTIIFLFLLFSELHAQIDVHSIEGSWSGKLNTGALSLRVIFNLSVEEGNTLTATMDSPDQGVKNIKIGPVTLNDDSIRIAAPILFGRYDGVIRDDMFISGTWKQHGQQFSLDLTKLSEGIKLNRPQEPQPPFPYSEEEVVFRNENDNIDLAGTLTLPVGEGPFKAAVLITGSGSQNRNEELMGHKPFMVIADRLTRNGIAVMRYDDRGVGQSGGNPMISTSANFATDVSSAVDFLERHAKISKKEIGLIGHSEGGIIAAMAASEKDVAFIISLAGTGLPGDRIIYRQSADISRASGASEKEIEKSAYVNMKLFPILKKEKDNMTASEKMLARYEKILDKEGVKGEEKARALQQVKASLNPASLTWLRYFISTDPALFWKKVKCPVLALNGGNDLQVAADENLEAIGKALKSGGNKSFKTTKMPGLNHLFQHSDTGLPSEYGDIEETFSEEVLEIISDWINALPANK